MREKPKDRGRLLHIMESLNNITEFLEGKTAEDFLLDKLLYFAIVKNLEIIGEASYMLSLEFKENHPMTSWKDMIGMRHILVHGYYQVDSRIIWATIVNDLPTLRKQIEDYLKEPEH